MPTMRNLSPEKKALLFLALVVLCSIIARALKARESAVSVQAGALDLESFARQTDSAVQQGRRRPRSKPKVSKRPSAAQPISLASATAAQLERLPGVTPTMAERIIAARDRTGGRLSLDDLAAIPGVGRRKAEAIRPYLRDLYVAPPLIGYQPKPDRRESTPGGSREGKPSVGPINVNRATKEELETLPGIGPSLAARILAEREKRGRFSTLAALDSVPGIGPALLEKLAPLLRF